MEMKGRADRSSFGSVAEIAETPTTGGRELEQKPRCAFPGHKGDTGTRNKAFSINNEREGCGERAAGGFTEVLH